MGDQGEGLLVVDYGRVVEGEAVGEGGMIGEGNGEFGSIVLAYYEVDVP